jgi:hypothetical protein
MLKASDCSKPQISFSWGIADEFAGAPGDVSGDSRPPSTAGGRWQRGLEMVWFLPSPTLFCGVQLMSFFASGQPADSRKEQPSSSSLSQEAIQLMSFNCRKTEIFSRLRFQMETTPPNLNHETNSVSGGEFVACSSPLGNLNCIDNQQIS